MKLNKNNTIGNTPRYQLNRQQIEKAFDVYPELGQIRWKKLTHGNMVSGFLGCNDNGYRKVIYKKMRLKIHNVIWNYVHGEIPAGYCVDHINNDRSDNRISNLRLVTYRENLWYNEREKQWAS